MSKTRLPTPPRSSLLLLEARATLDFARMFGPLATSRLRRRSAAARRAAEAPTLTIVVPGFGSSDRYTRPLRRFLNDRGFEAEGWGLGTNLGGTNLPHELSDLSSRWAVVPPPGDYKGEAGVPYLVDRFYDRVLQRHEATGRKISLIGWSLGGVLAREVARDLPEVVDRVITMGTPVVGGPKYTVAASLFKARGQNLDWIEAEIIRRQSRQITQPITAIVSRTDGIVGWEAAQDKFSPNVKHHSINAAHLGMGFKPEIWACIEDALSEAV